MAPAAAAASETITALLAEIAAKTPKEAAAGRYAAVSALAFRAAEASTAQTAYETAGSPPTTAEIPATSVSA